MKLSSILSCLLLPAFFACSASQPSAKPPRDKIPVAEKANVRTLPVPYGQKLSCRQMLSEDDFSSAMHREVSVKSEQARRDDITSSCSIHGETTLAAKRRKHRNARPKQAELCRIDIKCSYFYDQSREDQKCLESGGSVASGTLCIHASNRGAPRITGLDPDTQCKVEITMGSGVSAQDGAPLLELCSHAALYSIDRGSIDPAGHPTTLALSSK
jgi:hypothetical protein